ncbi:hypothetical protein [Polluticoccus soli]|uniref:hypothetical protein n=1 Tax=Polluticoccus soli TaxID=3034150 RepID=UPI0023E2461E|nr:hypothetical protein [Flavipsychrobacter sp. JY13-12]
MEKHVYSIRKEQRGIANLKYHPFYELMQIVGTDVYEIGTYRHFGLSDQVLATKDGRVLSNWVYVEVAHKMGLEEIEVVVIDDVDEEDILRLINLYGRRLKKLKYAVAVCGQYIEDFWDEGKGKSFYDEIPGNNSRDKIAYLLGVSVGTYSSICRIYKHDPELLEKVDRGEVTNEYALNLANQAEVKDANNKLKGPQKPKSYNAEDDTPEPGPILSVVRFSSISLVVEGYGEIVLAWEGEIVMAYLDGSALGEAIFSPSSPDHGETFHYIIQIPGIGSLHLMGVDFRRCLEFLNVNKQGGKNEKIDWFKN